jgi:hypothetical protein
MSRTKPAKRAREWEARTEQLRQQFELAWANSAHAIETAWHDGAVAALHWVSGHPSRMSTFRRSVKGTPAERVVSGALRAIRAEAKQRAPRRAARRKTRS